MRLAFVALVVGLAGAGATPVSAVRAEPALIIDGQVGPAFLGRSRSSAVGHAFKPAARLGVRLPLSRRVEAGAAVSGIVDLDGSDHYRVLGALGHARLAVWEGSTFSLGTAAALGVGYDADILHRDLQADAPVIPYGFLAIDGRWNVGRNLLLGTEAAWENLSIIRLGLLVGLRLGGVPDQNTRGGG